MKTQNIFGFGFKPSFGTKLEINDIDKVSQFNLKQFGDIADVFEKSTTQKPGKLSLIISKQTPVCDLDTPDIVYHFDYSDKEHEDCLNVFCLDSDNKGKFTRQLVDILDIFLMRREKKEEIRQLMSKISNLKREIALNTSCMLESVKCTNKE